MNRRKISTEELSRAAHVAPPPPDRAWHSLAKRLDERRRVRGVRKLVAVPALLALAGAAVLALHWQQRPAAQMMMAGGQAIESAGVELRLTLPDGIEVELGPTSRISVETVTPEELHVTLWRGTGRFRVEHRGGRQLSVDVDSMSVVVVGTRFEVARVDGADGTRMEVVVERGVVEVRKRDGSTEPRRLHAGERFSSLLSSPAANRAGGAAVADPEARASSERAAVGAETGARVRRVAVASAGRGTAGGARQLLERAQQQWRSGNLGEAADLYQEVLRRHPRDPRVGLAALELGRLRMDHVGDLEGALVSFRRAVRQAGGAAVHEDALARLVEASARLGYTAECAQARDKYLRRYPEGIHAAAVTATARDRKRRGCDRAGAGGARCAARVGRGRRPRRALGAQSVVAQADGGGASVCVRFVGPWERRRASRLQSDLETAFRRRSVSSAATSSGQRARTRRRRSSCLWRSTRR